MPTILPKTGIRVTRINQNLTNPADGISQTVDIIYEGLASVEDASGYKDFNKFFPSGTQFAKLYLIYAEPLWCLKTDDIIEFSESQIAENTLFSLDADNIKTKALVPNRTGALQILGSRHIEVLAISNN